MQKFSSMQRSSIFKTLLGLFSVFALFAFYNSIADIYVILPPLFGILFLNFCAFWRRGDYPLFLLVLVCLLWIELDKNLPFGSFFIFFFLLYLSLYRPISSFLALSFWVKFFCIFVVYIGFGAVYYSADLNLWDFILLLGGYILIEGVIIWLL